MMFHIPPRDVSIRFGVLHDANWLSPYCNLLINAGYLVVNLFRIRYENQERFPYSNASLFRSPKASSFVLPVTGFRGTLTNSSSKPNMKNAVLARWNT